jgi:cytochrome c
MPRVHWIGAAALAFAWSASPADAGDAKEGAAIYERCLGCHSLAADRTGPRHCGLFGRRAGTVTGFAYSDAMRSSKLVWSARTLDRFLAAPLAVMPGTSMGYAGITNPRERADLIAYLDQAGRSAACRKEGT